MKDPTWIDEAASAAHRALTGRIAPFATFTPATQELSREIVRAVLAVEDKNECRGPADRKA